MVVVGGCGRAWGWIKLRGFYISPHLMCSITFVFVVHFNNYLCISISPKILKEIFAIKNYTLSNLISLTDLSIFLSDILPWVIRTLRQSRTGYIMYEGFRERFMLRCGKPQHSKHLCVLWPVFCHACDWRSVWKRRDVECFRCLRSVTQ